MATKRNTTAEPKRIGRPPMPFDQDIADRVCVEIVNGKPLRAICRIDGMPSLEIIMRWLRETPAFVEQYTRAKDEQADTLADEILDIADDRQSDPDANSRRLRVDARKWVAAKLKPKKYSDYTRTDLDVKNDVADALSQARQRLAVVKPKPADSSAA